MKGMFLEIKNQNDLDVLNRGIMRASIIHARDIQEIEKIFDVKLPLEKRKELDLFLTTFKEETNNVCL